MEAYLSYVFSDSVSEQYSAFSSGFLKVCGGEILSLFQPSELMAMVVGNNNYNWEEMEKVSLAADRTLSGLGETLFQFKQSQILILTKCFQRLSFYNQ